MNSLKHFFWFCSGANQSLLKRCPTEASKFTGIGATVFFTGLLAALSGGYAFHTIFSHSGWAIAFGLLWGCVIFNLDRFIVSTMKKNRKGRWHELFMASPRILLAVMLAIVISKPLELKIFSKEIDRKLVLLEETIYQKEIATIDQRYQQQASLLQEQINTLKAEIEAKRAKRNELATLARQEADGTGGSMQRNAGPIYQLKKADADRAQTELELSIATNSPKIEALQGELTALRQKQNMELAGIQRNPWNGMAAQLEALRQISLENKAIYWANIFIIALFIMLECSPVIVKILAPRGPYDELLEIREHFFKNHNLEKIAQMDFDTRERLSPLVS
jgi:prefoldin subunit 5